MTMSDYTEAYTACGESGPRNMCCEREKGHDGPHEALDGEIVWSNNNDELE